MKKSPEFIRVFIADDHAIVRSGLRFFLESFDDFLLVGEAGDGLSAISGCKQTNPDVVLMDLEMPSISGIEATQAICKNNPSTRVIILSHESSHEKIMRAFQVGAANYVLKDITAEKLAEMIRLTYRGEDALSDEATRALISNLLQPEKPDYEITQREHEVLELMVKGFRNREIGERLFISNSTVRNHTSRILKKLSVSSRTEAVAVALKEGIVY